MSVPEVGKVDASELIFQALLAEVRNPRREATLKRLKKACDDLCERGLALHLSNIQHYVEDNFGKDAGPKAQSISNEKQRKLGMYHYVLARDREQQLVTSVNQNSNIRQSKSSTLSDIEGIDDMDVRANMRDLYDRLMVTEKQLARAKLVLKTLQPGADLDVVINGQASPTQSESPHFSHLQVSALGNLMRILSDNERLADVGLINDGKRVRRKLGTRDELFSVETLQHIEGLHQQLLRLGIV
ncbi:hypothetical protein [Paraburkholderia sp. DGU8]|uniref:hypothetical protein n=1 Tax=Paraburkholderia sp. DGU8 TaxID=3161997 RepID=UPI003465D50B